MMGSGWMYGYGYYNPFHGLWFIVIIAVIAYPLGRILNRIGLSPLWAILAFVPIVNLISLWIVAFADWPGKRAE